MAFINDETGELHLKVLYFGISGSGKTTNIQSLFTLTSQELSTRIFDLKESFVRSHFFDFLPMSLGDSRGKRLRLHLFTFPAHGLWPALQRVLLSGVDGLVFVLDSRLAFLQENERLLKEMDDHLRAFNRSLKTIPLVIQANHQDSDQACPLSSLQWGFSYPHANWVTAAAADNRGTLESLETIAQKIVDHLDGEESSLTEPDVSLRSASVTLDG